MMALMPKYPVFIPSKGRWESRLTVKIFEEIKLPYRIVVEPQEYDSYAAVIDPKKILVLPFSNKGLVVTRNWIWDYAQNELRAPWFWTFDDNIRALWRWNRNRKLRVKTPSVLGAIEDFTERYENIAIAGMNYFMFIKQKYPKTYGDGPFVLNTRIYSNMLIRTNIKDPRGKLYRNEGFYNDDTDLCLRVLKGGYCTVLFNAFLIEKSVTMTVKGGMTPYYQGDGRYKMAIELQIKHPDVTKVVYKWGRWQHQVDYRPFRGNKLIKKPGVVIPDEPNEYGMKLVKLSELQK